MPEEASGDLTGLAQAATAANNLKGPRTQAAPQDSPGAAKVRGAPLQSATEQGTPSAPEGCFELTECQCDSLFCYTQRSPGVVRLLPNHQARESVAEGGDPVLPFPIF